MYPKTLEEIKDPGVRARISIERRIVERLIDHALANGYELSVDDGDGVFPWTRNKAEVIDAIMNTDIDTLRYRLMGESVGWVSLVYGNNGYDVISDYTTRLEDHLAPVNAFADSLEPS